jgi:VCBS repeat protein
VDGDRKVDAVIVEVDSSSNLTLVVLPGETGGTLGVARPTPIPSIINLYRIELVDLTGDGVFDVAAVSDEGVEVYSGYGDGYFHPRGAYPFTFSITPTDAASIVFSDHNGDGRTDVAFWPGAAVGVALQGTCH